MHATIAERVKTLDILTNFECTGSNPASDQKIQIRHYLDMDILATDIVSFEISFRPGSKGETTSTSVIGEDSFTCKLTQDSDNP